MAVLAALALAACGGGGGRPGTTFPENAGVGTDGGGTSATPTPSVTTPDEIQSSALSANMCAAPRVGTDPVTGQPYPDRQGTLAQEKAWVRAWLDETYLWYDEIPSTIRAADYATPQQYFAALRTPALTPSGKPQDQFHFTFDTAVWRAMSQSGIEAGYGFDVAIINAQAPREVRVAFTDPGTPAAAAGITRGTKFITVDGVDVVNGTNVAALNAALFPTAAGESHSFQIEDLGGSRRTVVLTSAQITRVPVQNVRTLATPTGKVGYLLFNDHVATSEALLISAIAQFKADAVQDLVLDLRYNAGGFLDIASELAYMIASPQATTGSAFQRLQFNRKNPFQLTEDQTVTPFHASSLGFSTPAGQALPQLGLSRVTVLTGPETCSASEAIISGLRGVNVQVNLIGNTTCGKPYGFLPQDNCGTTYFAIQFKGVNNQNQGDFADGLAPTCTVADDFSHQLGDAAEARLAAALSYRVTGSCPAASTAVSKSGALIGTGEPLISGKPAPRSGALLRDGAFNRR